MNSTTSQIADSADPADLSEAGDRSRDAAVASHPDMPADGAPSKPSPPSSIKALAYRGAAWTIGGYGFGQVLRLASNLVLTRLLFPEAFGLMALVNIVVRGLKMFSDIGLGYSVVQHKRGDDPVFLDTIWTVQILRGLCLWGTSLLIAGPMAHFYDTPELAWFVPAAGFSAVIAGFNSTSFMIFRRHLIVRKLVIRDLVVQVFGLVAMIALAWATGSVWSIVVGGWVSAGLNLIISHTINPGSPNRLRWDLDTLRSIMDLGRWIFFSTILSFLAMQVDRLILGKLIPLAALGSYSIAYGLAQIPRMIAERIDSHIILPSICRRIDLTKNELRERLLGHRRSVLLAMAVGFPLLIGLGDLLILTLYDQRYQQAAWIFPLLTLGLWPYVLNATISSWLKADGKLHYHAIGNLLKFLFTLIFMPLSYYSAGIYGAIAIIALNDLPGYLANAWGRAQHGHGGFRQDGMTTALMLSLLAVVLVLRTQAGYPPTPPGF